jgi:hypothetical protein
MASSLSQLSASVTRILSLTGFPKELKTRDIQLAFSEWDNANGGFKIKWIDDTSLLIVFTDATVGEYRLLGAITSSMAVTVTSANWKRFKQPSEHIFLPSRIRPRYSHLPHPKLRLSFDLMTDRMLRQSFRT